MSAVRLSVAITARNEADRIAACLERLHFADEIVVLLDRCTDETGAVARRYTERVIEGAWEREGDRRNAAIAACRGAWVLEVDADEWVTPELAREILATVATTSFDWHEIPVDNFIGAQLVRWGWGASFGKAAYPGLFRREAKTWGPERVHPRLEWRGRKGPMLTERLHHHVDRDISDMIRRLDSYSTACARDLRERGEIGTMTANVRRLFSRFIKCYLLRKGYREGGYGFLIALFAGLYPVLSHLKAKLETE
ncbi:MAG: glycosyltransferase family 2 protein [Proteobacteria bacterium]|nr:glycosyltransferase family 2 protein [Pseudomonadota bacterium]